MSAENKKIVQRIYDEVGSQSRLETIDQLYSADFALDDPLTPGVKGPDGYKFYVQSLYQAFPDLKIEVLDQVAEGDKVAIRWVSRGTHKGEMMGIPPTGKQGSSTGMTISRIVDGKVVSETSEWNALGMLQTLGIIPGMVTAS